MKVAALVFIVSLVTRYVLISLGIRADMAAIADDMVAAVTAWYLLRLIRKAEHVNTKLLDNAANAKQMLVCMKYLADNPVMEEAFEAVLKRLEEKKHESSSSIRVNSQRNRSFGQQGNP